MAQSDLFAEDTHASPLVLPASEEARKMTVTSGLKCIELLKLSGHDGSLPRMLLGTSAWVSTVCYLTWKTRTTDGGHLFYQLAPSMPSTDETEFGLWATPNTMDTLPPKDEENSKNHRSRKNRARSGNLREQVAHPAMWPTPRACEAEGGTITNARAEGGYWFRENKEGVRWGVKLRDAVASQEKLQQNPKARKMMPTPTASDFIERESSSTEKLNPMTGKSVSLDRFVKFWPTEEDQRSGIPKLLPTPTGQDNIQVRGVGKATGKRGTTLGGAARMWPTPATRDYKGSNSQKHLDKERGHHDQLPNAVKMTGETGGQLNPDWVSWLMGYPEGWTDITGE